MRNLIIIFTLLLPAPAFAQLWAPGADYKQPTTGLTDGQTDTVYVFYDDRAMSLAARQPAGETAQFIWEKLDVANIRLDTVLTESGVESTLADITEGGYRVKVRSLSLDTTFTTWVFRDTFRIDSIDYEIACDLLKLTMHTTPDITARYTIYNFEYFLAPPHGGENFFNRAQSVLWAPSVDIFPGIDDADESWKERISRSTYIESPPPLRDAGYTLEVKDVFGKSATYTTPYDIEAIAVYAWPGVEAQEKDESWKDAGEQPEGEALYTVRFLQNKSVNANKFKWEGFAGSNTTLTGAPVAVWTDSTSAIADYIYPRMPYNIAILNGYTPGSYQVRLTVSNETCSDTASVFLSVVPSQFAAAAVPNAFTPNGDNMNDIFTFVKGQEPVSMEFVRVFIYNRSGGLVYRYEGRADRWEGWNGRMMGTGNDSSEGVYYYVITGRGWDEVDYNSKEFSGYLHLFR